MVKLNLGRKEKIGEKWQKMVKIDQNWSEVIMLVKNGQRVKIRQKLLNIAKK